MRYRFMAIGGALVALAFVACNGSSSSTYIAPPSGSVASGALALGPSASSQAAGTANGITAVLTYPGGTGSVTATSSASAPAGTTTVSPADLRRAQGSATSTVVYYVTISSAAGATLTGLPAAALTLTTAPIGTYQEAQFTGTTWANVSGVTSTVNTAGTAVEFSAGSSAVTIPANGSIYLAFYQGNYPQPTPTPVATPQQILADTGFESGVAGAYGTAVGSTGWTQCSISSAATGSGPLPNPGAFSKYTPTPNTTPGAVIESAGTAVPTPAGTAPPIQTVTAVPVNSGTHAAVLGGVFSSYNQEDFAYNGLCQTITVPQNPVLTMYVYANGNQPTKYFHFDVDLLNTSGAFLTNAYEDPSPITSTKAGDTAYRLITVPAASLQPYVGQTVELFLGIWISGESTKYSGYYFVGDATLMGIVQR
jgi:hypothetical protein